jgi:GTP-binding protein YchF
MNLSIGIVGLPNVGKSTTFNALVEEQNAQVANYPFCTIEPNKAIVPVPDPRLSKLTEIVQVPKAVPATIEFVDIAGLVKGASGGEGLGNQFLGHIRNVDAILHVVRCFDDENVVHVSAHPNPQEDIEIINTELSLADYQQIERKIEKLERQVKGDKKLMPVLEMAFEIKDFLAAGTPLWRFEKAEDAAFKTLNNELQFLTAKPIIYLANVDEDGLLENNPYFLEAQNIAGQENAPLLKICSKLEEDLIPLEPADKAEYLEISGIKETSIEKVITTCYRILNLISFFTFNEKETHAWTIEVGWKAPQAAGQIHTDFELGFIRAEVAPFDVFEEYKSWAALKEVGLMKSEGREYIVRDGDVILFRFNV